MKKTILFLLIHLSFSMSFAQVKMPALSPVQTIKQDIGVGFIELKYARPSARDRKVFGNVVPYNTMWRTGANAATLIKFTDKVTINDKILDTGSYALYTIPGKENWEIIFNKGVSNWGNDGYKETEDVLRITVPVNKLKKAVETFTIAFENMKLSACDIHLIWEKTDVSFSVTMDVKEKLKAQIEAGMNADKKPYYQAAQFYNEYEIDLPKALTNVDKAIEANPTAFWMMLYKAKIQEKMGDFKGALITSQQSMEAAKKADNPDYIKSNTDFQKAMKAKMK
jgi:tetratricopeptide (TPR) repeat protein